MNSIMIKKNIFKRFYEEKHFMYINDLMTNAMMNTWIHVMRMMRSKMMSMLTMMMRVMWMNVT